VLTTCKPGLETRFWFACELPVVVMTIPNKSTESMSDLLEITDKK
jgi:hypothetical protein